MWLWHPATSSGYACARAFAVVCGEDRMAREFKKG